MEWIQYDGMNNPPIGEVVLCQTEYWKDLTPAFFVPPSKRQKYYLLLYFDGTVWRDHWKKKEMSRNYPITHWARIQGPTVDNRSDYYTGYPGQKNMNYGRSYYTPSIIINL